MHCIYATFVPVFSVECVVTLISCRCIKIQHSVHITRIADAVTANEIQLTYISRKGKLA